MYTEKINIILTTSNDGKTDDMHRTT